MTRVVNVEGVRLAMKMRCLYGCLAFLLSLKQSRKVQGRTSMLASGVVLFFYETRVFMVVVTGANDPELQCYLHRSSVRCEKFTFSAAA